MTYFTVACAAIGTGGTENTIPPLFTTGWLLAQFLL
jgi:hypothetical protein